MGAYTDPGPAVRDRSAEIYSGMLSNIGKSFAKGIENYRDKQERLADETEATRQGNQNIWLNTELTQNSNHQKNLDKFEDTKKNETLFGIYQDKAGLLLNGDKDEDGEYIEGGNIGAKQARYRLQTEKNLTNKDKQEYLDVISKYENFMHNGRETVGSLTAEGIEFDEYDRSKLDRTFTFKGTGIEKTRNMYAYFALTGKPAGNGVTYTTDVYAGDKGENMLKATITFDPKSIEDGTNKDWEQLSPADQEKIIANGYKLDFDQDWGKWKKDGFLTPIEQGLSKEKLNESIKFEKDGNLVKDMETTEYISKTSKDLPGGTTETNQTSENILNTPLFLERSKLLIQAKTETIVSMNPQEQNDYVAYTLEQGGSDFKRNKTIINGTQDLEEDGKTIIEGTGKTLDQLLENSTNATDVLTKLGQDQFIKDNFGKYVAREASAEQAKRLNELNGNIKENGTDAQVKEGDEIYIRSSEKTLQTDTPPPKVDKPKGLTEPQINTLQKRILDLKYPTTENGKIDRSKLGSLLNDKGWTVTVDDYDDGSSKVFIRNSSGKTTSAIEIEEDISPEKLNRILAQSQGVGVEMSNELFGNVEPDASGSENFDPQSMINDVFKDIQRNK
tara:strand:+ start:519 stop:2366 length:1848 start_codon:yes stop_codon:yes gene_type:complete